MRKYEKLWNVIKAKGGCKIAAPNMFHARIKKAVAKEFGRDEDFRDELAANGVRCYVRKVCSNDMITFTLKRSAGFADFGVATDDIVALELEEINFEELLK